MWNYRKLIKKTKGDVLCNNSSIKSGSCLFLCLTAFTVTIVSLVRNTFSMSNYIAEGIQENSQTVLFGILYVV
jgi:hypothetical protein